MRNGTPGHDTSPKVYFSEGDFENEEQFLRWVASYHGSDVSDTCKAHINKCLANGQDVDAIKILDDLTRATRQIDLAKNKLRVRFVW